MGGPVVKAARKVLETAHVTFFALGFMKKIKKSKTAFDSALMARDGGISN